MPDAIVSMNQTVLNQEVKNILCFSNVTEDADELQDFADAIRDSWVSVIDNLHTSWSLENLTISFLDATSVTYSVDVDFTAGPLGGTNANDPTPTTNSLLIATSYVGPRPNRGRVYFCGLTEVDTNDGLWVTGVAVEFRNLVQEWADGVAVTGNTYFLRILRRPNPPEWDTYTSNPVTGTSLKSVPATQRRRRITL